MNRLLTPLSPAIEVRQFFLPRRKVLYGPSGDFFAYLLIRTPHNHFMLVVGGSVCVLWLLLGEFGSVYTLKMILAAGGNAALNVKNQKNGLSNRHAWR